MSFETDCVRVFAGHQTFHPRYGWLKKGLDAVAVDPKVFSNEDATVTLGVGKNMVDAIRFWGQSFGLITEISSGRNSGYAVTQFGQSLMAEGGLDPYIEDLSTLWILHWRALAPTSQLPIWWLAFNQFPHIEFSEDLLVEVCTDIIEASQFKSPNVTSIQKDVDCFLRMYSTKGLRGRQTIEDRLDSPFRELGLVTPSPGKESFQRFVSPHGHKVPSIAVVYAILDFLSIREAKSSTTSLTRLTIDEGSPGKVFKIGEQDVVAAIEEVFPDGEHAKISSAAGALQLNISGDPAELAHRVLIDFHASRGVRKKSRKDALLAGPSSRLVNHDAADASGAFAFIYESVQA